jgi:hypothetical protein
VTAHQVMTVSMHTRSRQVTVFFNNSTVDNIWLDVLPMLVNSSKLIAPKLREELQPRPQFYIKFQVELSEPGLILTMISCSNSCALQL